MNPNPDPYSDLPEEHWHRDTERKPRGGAADSHVRDFTAQSVDSADEAEAERRRPHVVCPQCGGTLVGPNREYSADDDHDVVLVYCEDCGLILDDAPATEPQTTNKKTLDIKRDQAGQTPVAADSKKWGDAATRFKQDYADSVDKNNWGDHKERTTARGPRPMKKKDYFSRLFDRYVKGEFDRGLTKPYLLVHMEEEYGADVREEFEDAEFDEIVAAVERREGGEGITVGGRRKQDFLRRLDVMEFIEDVPITLSSGEVDMMRKLSKNKANPWVSFGGKEGYQLSMLAHVIQTTRGVDPFEGATWLREMAEERLGEPWIEDPQAFLYGEEDRAGGAIVGAVEQFKRAVGKWSDIHREPENVALTGAKVWPDDVPRQA